MRREYITCREVVEFLADYLAGELGEREKLEFERHLAVCPPCVNYLKTYQATIRLEKAAFPKPDAPASRDVPEDMVKAILAARKAGK